jgi:four helix bundle protein
MRKEIEDRLVALAISINRLSKIVDRSFLAKHLSKQIIRSSSSAALNYGEAQAAESKKDFVHKISLLLKELRETQICLKLLSDSIKQDHKDQLKICQEECRQLVAIFHKTVMTAKSKN